MNYRKNSNNFLIFSLEQQQYALHLSAVESVVWAVEITRLPKAPEIVMGLVNVRGRIFPVVNTRRRFNLSEREIEQLMRKRGAVTVAQDKDTSLIFGMPGEAVKIGAARYVLPPSKISQILTEMVDRKTS